jgi:hypothetical protein
MNRADDQDDPHAEAGRDIGNKALPRGTAEDWRNWGARFLTNICTTCCFEEIDEWLAANDETLVAMRKEAPKIHDRLIAAVGRQRLATNEASAVHDNPLQAGLARTGDLNWAIQCLTELLERERDNPKSLALGHGHALATAVIVLKHVVALQETCVRQAAWREVNARRKMLPSEF